ncbi:MAG: DUF3014 domain-containing protein [Rhodanobacter sp.]
MRRQASTGSWIAAAVVVIVLIGAGVWLVRRAMQPEAAGPPLAETATPASSGSTAAPPIQHPIAQVQATPASASTAPLPALDQSDDDVLAGLQRLAGDSELSLLLVRPQIIARIVASIDAMPGRSLGGVMMPARPPKSAFVTGEMDGQTVIGEANAARYAPYMAIVEQIDPQALVAWYVHAYPLFQQAYEHLGYPHGYFNDRLIVVIDNLLAAPEPATPPALLPSRGRYVFADPGLEARSAGQRLLLRTGPANEAKIKARLRTIRGLLVGQHLQPAEAGSATGATTSK